MEIVPVSLPPVPRLFLVVDDERDQVIAPFLKRHGLWEPAETYILLRLLKPGYRVVDIGANIGYYMVLFSRLVGPSGWVCAFEPEPANFRLLCANALINDCVNVVCEPKAVADAAGRQFLHLSSSNLGDHRLYPVAGRAACEVETIVLDDYLADQPVDFVKIDTQGSEPRVLGGMRRLIDRCRDQLGCLMEFCPGLLRQSGAGLEGFLAQLQSLQARVYWLDLAGDKVSLTRLAQFATELRSLAQQMQETGVEDFARDILVFFSDQAEQRHLASNAAVHRC